MMDDQAEHIEGGTLVELDGVLWCVLRPSDPGRFDFPSYVCEQLTGDRSRYPRCRNPDGTIDMDGDAIVVGLGL